MFLFFCTFARNYGAAQNIYCLKPNLDLCPVGPTRRMDIWLLHLSTEEKSPFLLLPLLPILLRGDNGATLLCREWQSAWSACPVFGCVMYHERERSCKSWRGDNVNFTCVTWFGRITSVESQRGLWMFARALPGRVFMLNGDWCYVWLGCAQRWVAQRFALLFLLPSPLSVQRPLNLRSDKCHVRRWRQRDLLQSR